MEKTELIFAIIVMIAYVICSVALKIPIIAHLMFGSLLLGVIIIAMLLKLKRKYDNEKISKIFRIISIILIICYGIAFIYETIYYKPLFIDSPIFIFLILIFELISWILRKNSD
jgi:hypothetical protein